MDAARGLKPGLRIGASGIIGCQDIGKDRHDDEDEHHPYAKERRLTACEPADGLGHKSDSIRDCRPRSGRVRLLAGALTCAPGPVTSACSFITYALLLVLPGLTSGAIMDPWVEERVHEVNHKVNHDKTHGDEKGEPLHLLIITGNDGLDAVGA